MDRILRLGSGGLPGVGQVSLESHNSCVLLLLVDVEIRDRLAEQETIVEKNSSTRVT